MIDIVEYLSVLDFMPRRVSECLRTSGTWLGLPLSDSAGSTQDDFWRILSIRLAHEDLLRPTRQVAAGI